MKPAIALIIAAIAILVIVLRKNSDAPGSSPSSDQGAPNPSSENTAPASPDTLVTQGPTHSSQKREISERTKTAKWHPTEKGHLISPYNNETLLAIGVIAGSKMKDSDGNTFNVPSFEKSPFAIKALSAPVPDRPGFVFNPFNRRIVDARGIPADTLIRDPQDSDPEHVFRIPPKKSN